MSTTRTVLLAFSLICGCSSPAPKASATAVTVINSAPSPTPTASSWLGDPPPPLVPEELDIALLRVNDGPRRPRPGGSNVVVPAEQWTEPQRRMITEAMEAWQSALCGRVSFILVDANDPPAPEVLTIQNLDHRYYTGLINSNNPDLANGPLVGITILTDHPLILIDSEALTADQFSIVAKHELGHYISLLHSDFGPSVMRPTVRESSPTITVFDVLSYNANTLDHDHTSVVKVFCNSQPTAELFLARDRSLC